MKKNNRIFTFLCAFLCLVSLNAREVYIVGDSSPAGWSTGADDLAKTTMTEVSPEVFEWTGILTETTSEGFKLLTQKDWNPAIHPSTPGLILNEVGSDVVALPYAGDPDTKWRISETAEYKLRVTFRESDVLVEIEKVGNVGGVDIPEVDGVYQISTAAQLELFSSKLNEGIVAPNSNVVLTQDIDLSGIATWTAIGTDSKKFTGVFDGQGYRIKGMKLDGNKKEQGFFGVAGPGAVIKNLVMDASCIIESTGGACLAAFVGCCNNDGTITFENCGNEASVTGTAQNNAAFLGCNYGGTKIVFNNCYNTGKISGGWENGAFSGWTGGGATFNNCYNIGEITEGETWARGSKTINNCYQTVGADVGVIQISNELVASGELCYKLNGDQNVINWYQNLSGTIDAMPVPFNTHSQVFANGNLKCDGTSAGGELTYSNSNTSEIPPHTNENGWCSVCGTFDASYLAVDADGVYHIGNANDLNWFAALVLNANTAANAKLTADIDYTAYKQGFIGANQSKAFNGTFDGQGHTITIDIVNDGTTDRTGLFAYINAATIKNLVVQGSATSADRNCVGGLGGRSDGEGTLIENVIVKTAVSYTGSNGDATCGGFFANMEAQATLRNCAFLGSINTGSAEGNGGLVGWAGSSGNNKYINCLVAPVSYTQNGNSGDYARNNPSVTNCFKVSADDARLASGKLCYELNAGGENWFQNLGDGGDSHPVPFSSHAAVCKTSETGWATFYDAENALRFKGVKAYTGKIVGQWLNLNEVEEIPAATAVILEGTYYNKVVLDGAAEVEGNDLCGATADFATTGAEYVFDKKEDAPAFYKASEGTTIVAGTVYLYVADSEVEAYILDLEGNADSIEGIEADHNASVVIFDLAGRRVQKAQKGIYIVNGKKIAVQ